jgi:hypothetical protein
MGRNLPWHHLLALICFYKPVKLGPDTKNDKQLGPKYERIYGFGVGLLIFLISKFFLNNPNGYTLTMASCLVSYLILGQNPAKQGRWQRSNRIGNFGLPIRLE